MPRPPHTRARAAGARCREDPERRGQRAGSTPTAGAWCIGHRRRTLLTEHDALVTDFVAKALDMSRFRGRPRRPGHLASSLTFAGNRPGTPAYMAPKQALADPAMDHRADVWACWRRAYEMLTGSAPFAGRSPQRLLAAHAMEPPPAIATLRAGLPASLVSLVMRCLEKHPADRPQSAMEVLRELEDVAGTTGAAIATDDPPASAPNRASREGPRPPFPVIVSAGRQPSRWPAWTARHRGAPAGAEFDAVVLERARYRIFSAVGMADELATARIRPGPREPHRHVRGGRAAEGRRSR